MTKDLDDELEDGTIAAAALVLHLNRMGAGGCMIPVSHVDEDGRLQEWEVTAKLVSVLNP